MSHLFTPQERYPGALPECVSFTATSFSCRTLTMATLRLALLVALLLGLTLLTAPHDADGALVRKLSPLMECWTEYLACTTRRQRCAECVTICKTEQVLFLMPVSAASAVEYCKKRM